MPCANTLRNAIETLHAGDIFDVHQLAHQGKEVHDKDAIRESKQPIHVSEHACRYLSFPICPGPTYVCRIGTGRARACVVVECLWTPPSNTWLDSHLNIRVICMCSLVPSRREGGRRIGIRHPTAQQYRLQESACLPAYAGSLQEGDSLSRQQSPPSKPHSSMFRAAR